MQGSPVFHIPASYKPPDLWHKLIVHAQDSDAALRAADRIGSGRILQIVIDDTSDPYPLTMIDSSIPVHAWLPVFPLDDLVKLAIHVAGRPVTVWLKGRGPLFPAVNTATAVNFQVCLTVDMFAHPEMCNEVIDHFFHSKMLHVPIQPLFALVSCKMGKEQTDLWRIYGEDLGVDYYVDDGGNVALSMRDLNEAIFIGKAMESSEVWASSKHYVIKKNRHKMTFTSLSPCAKCPVYNFCRGYLVSNSVGKVVRIEKEELCRSLIGLQREISRKSDGFKFCVSRRGDLKIGPVVSRTATVFVAWRCVNSCIFCAAAEARNNKFSRGSEETIDAIKKFAAEGATTLSISGAGEPTLVPELEEYIELSSQAGFKEIVVFTNGSGLTKGKAEHLKNLGVTGYLLSLHGLERSHDLAVRRSGSFKEIMQAIQIAGEVGVGAYRTINTCLTRMNMKEIPTIIKLGVNEGVDRHSITFPEWSGNAIKFHEQLLSYTETSEALSFLDPFEYKHVILDNIPLCVARPDFPRVVKTGTSLVFDHTQFGQVDELAGLKSRNVFPRACRFTRCPLINRCVGVDATYIIYRGEKEFIELRSNLSFSGWLS